LSPILSWAENNPEFEHIYFDQEMKDDFMSSFDHLDLKNAYFHYGTMRTAQADIFRTCFLYHSGGVYADSDLMCISNISKHIDLDSDLCLEASLPLFLSHMRNSLNDVTRKIKVVESMLSNESINLTYGPFLQNHFFACSPKSRFLELVMDEISKLCFDVISNSRYGRRSEIGVTETGPSTWGPAFLKLLYELNNESVKNIFIGSPAQNGLFLDIRGSGTWNDGPFTSGKINSLPYIFQEMGKLSKPCTDNNNKNLGTIKFHIEDGHGNTPYEGEFSHKHK
jgi:hypothetical protein